MLLKVFVIVVCLQLISCNGLEMSDFTAEAMSDVIMARLGMEDAHRKLSVEKLTGLGDIVDDDGIFGYISIDEALGNCEKGIRDKVEAEIKRLRAIAIETFFDVGRDVEQRCRSYAVFGLDKCRIRVDSLANELKKTGKAVFIDELAICRLEVIDVAEGTKDSEEVRLRRKGENETDSFRNFYEDLGKIEEKKIRKEFEGKMKKAENEIKKEFTERGKQMEEMIRMEYELKGEIMKMELNQTYTLRGFNMMKKIEKEFKQRGEKLKAKIKKDKEKEGKKKMNEVEKKFQKEGNKIRDQREAECKGMTDKACENVKFDTPGDDVCLDLDFALGGRRKRKTQRRKPSPRSFRSRNQKSIPKYVTAHFS